MNRLIYLFLAALLTFSFVSAQDTDSSHHNDETHEESHGDDMSDDSTNEESMSHDDEHGDHDMSEMDDAAMDDMNMADGATEAMNTVMLGGQSVTLDPLIAMDGTFTLGLRAAATLGDFTLDVTTPEGTEFSFDELSSSSLALLDLGQAESGVYRFSGAHDGADFAFPVSIYQQTTAEAEAYLVLAPTPTLANRGASEIFANVIRDGDNVHGDYSLNRSMAGMQHSTDGDALTLSHTHFEDSYDEVFDTAPVSNQVALNFPMVGTWQVNLDVTDEDTAETLSFEPFEIEMLED